MEKMQSMSAVHRPAPRQLCAWHATSSLLNSTNKRTTAVTAESTFFPISCLIYTRWERSTSVQSYFGNTTRFPACVPPAAQIFTTLSCVAFYRTGPSLLSEKLPEIPGTRVWNLSALAPASIRPAWPDQAQDSLSSALPSGATQPHLSPASYTSPKCASEFRSTHHSGI